VAAAETLGGDDGRGLAVASGSGLGRGRGGGAWWWRWKQSLPVVAPGRSLAVAAEPGLGGGGVARLRGSGMRGMWRRRRAGLGGGVECRDWRWRRGRSLAVAAGRAGKWRRVGFGGGGGEEAQH